MKVDSNTVIVSDFTAALANGMPKNQIIESIKLFKQCKNFSVVMPKELTSHIDVKFNSKDVSQYGKVYKNSVLVFNQ